jgi:hypothetical protein
MTSLLIEQFTCRQDNFGVILHDPLTGETASIDAPDASRITDRLGDGGWKLSHLLITHHHPRSRRGHSHPLSHAYAPESDRTCRGGRRRSEGLTETVRDGDTFDFAGRTVQVISTPGHTAWAMSVSTFPTMQSLLFAGDTLFALGCGRLFEGTPEGHVRLPSPVWPHFQTKHGSIAAMNTPRSNAALRHHRRSRQSETLAEAQAPKLNDLLDQRGHADAADHNRL